MYAMRCMSSAIKYIIIYIFMYIELTSLLRALTPTLTYSIMCTVLLYFFFAGGVMKLFLNLTKT